MRKTMRAASKTIILSISVFQVSVLLNYNQSEEAHSYVSFKSGLGINLIIKLKITEILSMNKTQITIQTPQNHPNIWFLFRGLKCVFQYNFRYMIICLLITIPSPLVVVFAAFTFIREWSMGNSPQQPLIKALFEFGRPSFPCLCSHL